MMRIFLAVVVALIPNISGKPADCPPLPPPITCDDNSVMCPPIHDINGCMMPRQCVTPTFTSGDHPLRCPVKDICPSSSCKPNELSCEIPSDLDGCGFTISCRPATIGEGLNMCPGVCPVKCTGIQTHCGPHYDARGCEMPGVCANSILECPGFNGK